VEYQHGKQAQQRRDFGREQRRRRPRPEDDGIARCEFCRAKITWAYPVPSVNARSDAGRDPKPMPMDYEPDPLGAYTLYQEKPSQRHPTGCLRAGQLSRGQLTGWRAAGKPTYQRHFKTCPKKGDWGKLGKPYGQRQVTR